MKRIKLSALALTVMYFIYGCSKPLSPVYFGYDNFRLEKLGLAQSILATNVKLYNPNRYPLKLKSAALDIFINDAFLGHSAMDSLVTLPAKDTTYIPLRLQASAKDILSHTVKILINPNVKIKITGSAKAGRGGFFINVPINYEGTQHLELPAIK